MDRLRVAALQMPHGATWDANAATARSMLSRARDAGADLALLPEYWFATGPPPADPAPLGRALRAFYEEASHASGLAVAGNLLEPGPAGTLNRGVVYDAGRPLLEQEKAHPMPREAASGVVGGDAWRVAPVRGVETGMLVCADVLYPEAARILQVMGARLLLNPVMSPWRAVDNTREAREAIFIARAYDAGAFLVKAGGFRRAGADGQGGIAGRSLVTAPWGALAHYRDDFEEEVLVADLDFARLDEFRKHQATFPARRPSAYQELVRG